MTFGSHRPDRPVPAPRNRSIQEELVRRSFALLLLHPVAAAELQNATAENGAPADIQFFSTITDAPDRAAIAAGSPAAPDQ
jgi:hypothetical protein